MARGGGDRPPLPSLRPAHLAVFQMNRRIGAFCSHLRQGKFKAHAGSVVVGRRPPNKQFVKKTWRGRCQTTSNFARALILP